MRIISQNGTLDVNYDNCTFKIKSNCVTAQILNGKDYIMGKYDTLKRAIEVMIDIRSSFQVNCKVFKMPTE